jgi:tyrosyl-tRNA synthetase
MSKSLGNYIGINEPPAEIFGKVMSVSDELMWRYYELLTDLTPAQIGSLRSSTEKGERNPRDLKADLAKMIISDFHSTGEAQKAEEEFIRRFRNKETPDEVEERVLPSNYPKGWSLPHLLVTVGLAASMAEARRLIQQGGVGVYVDDEQQTIANSTTLWKPGMSTLLRVGKRRYVRVRFEN